MADSQHYSKKNYFFLVFNLIRQHYTVTTWKGDATNKEKGDIIINLCDLAHSQHICQIFRENFILLLSELFYSCAWI